MSQANTPLVNRLILLVLTLNLVCLVLLVVRSYEKPAPEAPAPAAVVEAEAAPAPRQLEPPRNLSPAPVPPRRVERPSPPAAAEPLPPPGRPAVPAPEATVAAVPSPPAEPPPPLVNVGSTRLGRPELTGAKEGESLGFSGRVFLRGTPKPEIPIRFGPACSALRSGPATTRHYVVSPEGGLANVLVVVENVSAFSGTPLVEPPVLTDVGCMLEPYVMGVVAGQAFQVQNIDPVLHNFHFTPRVNREVNFTLSNQGQAHNVAFPDLEFDIRLKCDVHPWEFAYVNVLPHPFFAITDTNGFYQIPAGLSVGSRLKVSARHLKAGRVTQEIKLRRGAEQTLDFILSVPGTEQARNQ